MRYYPVAIKYISEGESIREAVIDWAGQDFPKDGPHTSTVADELEKLRNSFGSVRSLDRFLAPLPPARSYHLFSRVLVGWAVGIWMYSRHRYRDARVGYNIRYLHSSEAIGT
jgi:hypothetical protein